MTSPKRLAAMGGGLPPVYIEDVFSTWLYTGTGSAQTINNGIDLTGKGGIAWIKNRGNASADPSIYTTSIGNDLLLATNKTDALNTVSNSLSFTNSGFSLSATNIGYWNTNQSGFNYVSWTFRKQPKFFDVVTWVGNGVDRDISHNLQSVPGCIIIKRTDSTGDWIVYHRGLSNSGSNYSIKLNTTAAEINQGGLVATSTTFTLYNAATVNTNGATYVAYVFAHNAGGFGLTGTDNVISCGSYTGNGSATGPVVELGYEPQWLLIKQSSIEGANWILVDNMRGLTADGGNAILYANLSNSEASASPRIAALATGFQPRFSGYEFNQSGQTYIYIAIRRGPMRTPTTGTSVFAPVLVSEATSSPFLNTFTAGFVVDWTLEKYRDGSAGTNVFGRLTGTGRTYTNSTNAESAATGVTWASMTGATIAAPSGSPGSTVIEAFRRAPGFFDMVCYTGNGSADRQINHNLGVAPELMLMKSRSAVGGWNAGAKRTAENFWSMWNLADGFTTNAADSDFPISFFTATQFTVGSSYYTNSNDSGTTYAAYLFASCPGVSKVGSYTGTGAAQTIDCGFTSGARFVLIKRTDVSGGGWFVWDTARGITGGNDPYFVLNNTTAEVTNTDFVSAQSSGFGLTASAPGAINGSGGTFIFFAVA